MFGRATITLGIGPHSSLYYLFMSALCNRADHIYFHPVVCYGRPME